MCSSCNKQPSVSPLCKQDTEHMRLSLCSQFVNHCVWPQASCWLRLSLGTGTARIWQLDLCPRTGNAHCCAKQHYFSSFDHVKKGGGEKKIIKKCKLQCSFNRKARLCICPIPKFLLLPSFCFQIHPLNFFNLLLYCFNSYICLIFAILEHSALPMNLVS